MRLGAGDGGHFFAQFEFDSAVLDGHDASAADDGAGRNIEFLAHAGAQNADQMIGVLAGEGGAVARDFIGDPSAAGHGEGLQASGSSASFETAAARRRTSRA